MRNRALLSCTLVLVAVLVSGCGGSPVPDVEGKPLGEATTTLAAAGFNTGRTTYDESTRTPAGTVVNQEPSPGVSAAAGSDIDLTVTGPAPIPAPNVVGMVEIPARMALVEAGLLVAGVSFVYDETVPEGSVVAQEPAAGVGMPKGSGVFLVLSRGPRR